MRNFLFGVAGLVGLVGLVIFLVVFAVLGKGCDYAGSLANRVANPDIVVENYEWFIQQYHDIQAMDPKIADAKAQLDQFKTDAGPRDKWTFDDRQESDRLSSILTGLQQQKQQMVADYNARVDMKTRDWLRSKNMPDHIDGN